MGMRLLSFRRRRVQSACTNEKHSGFPTSVTVRSGCATSSTSTPYVLTQSRITSPLHLNLPSEPSSHTYNLQDPHHPATPRRTDAKVSKPPSPPIRVPLTSSVPLHTQHLGQLPDRETTHDTHTHILSLPPSLSHTHPHVYSSSNKPSPILPKPSRKKKKKKLTSKNPPHSSPAPPRSTPETPTTPSPACPPSRTSRRPPCPG